MQAFEISAARALNQACSRRGRVFSDRYHPTTITSPRAAKHALSYVLNNWRRHRQDQGMESMFWTVDPYASATCFDGWRHGPRRDAFPEPYVPLPTSRAETWLLTAGWKRHGLLSETVVPGAAAPRS